ncbi:MAG: hypothetical protein IJ156_09860 [Bacteroidales bacterium]|nr:hypothetical protein [Bacteroidales bacterium]
MTRRLLPYIGLVLAAFTLFSCKKKEEETTTKPYLYGVTFDLATFARPGDTFTLKPYGVFTTEGEGVDEPIYKWRVNSDEFQTTDTFTVKFEEVGNYTITCQASDPDENYYATSTSKIIIVIDPALGETLNGTGIDEDDPHITDPRDAYGENDYFYARIGDLDWFRNNLAYTGLGLAYENADVTSYPIGRFYTWGEAMDACPEGWRLPTAEEWATLGKEAAPLLADAYLNSKRMWEYWPAAPRTNTTTLAIIPSGYALPSLTTPTFKRMYDYAAFWTASEHPEDGSLARYFYIFTEENEVRSTYGEKGSLALSVRCVR